MRPAISSDYAMHIVRPMASYESLPSPIGLADALMPKWCHVVYFVRPKVQIAQKEVKRRQLHRGGKRSVAETEAKYAAAADVIRRMWAEGANAYVIEAATGIHRSSILRWLQKKDLHRPAPRLKKTKYGSHRVTFEDNLALIKLMISEGKRNVDICQHFGMDRATVGRYVSEMNLRN